MVEYYACYFCGKLIDPSDDYTLPLEIYPAPHAHRRCAGVDAVAVADTHSGVRIGAAVLFNGMRGEIESFNSHSAFVRFDNGLSGTLLLSELLLTA